ncbi:hypothetical protein Tco_0499810 [Tanacetum coccineum]
MVTCCGKRAELLGSEERWRALGILHKISTSRQQLSIGNLSLTKRWLSMKKDIASCGSKYLAYSEVEVEYQGSSGLLLQPELPE